MSKWINAAHAITRKSGGGGSAESARSQTDTLKTAANGLYTLYAPPTPPISKVDATAISAPVDAGQDRQRTLEPAEFAELVRLVNLVADHHAFTQIQRAEAQQIAQGDAVAALECFRSLAERDGLTVY